MKLDDNTKIDAVLRDNDVVHFVTDGFYHKSEKILIYYKNREIGRVGWREGDTALTVKLRVQQQLGFPVACVDLKEDGKSLANDQKVGHVKSCYDKINKLTVNGAKHLKA